MYTYCFNCSFGRGHRRSVGILCTRTVLTVVLEEATDAVLGNSALITVLRQEIDRFNNLLHIIHKSLSELTQAVKGEIIMSDLLEDAYKALLTQRVPTQWKVT